MRSKLKELIPTNGANQQCHLESELTDPGPCSHPKTSLFCGINIMYKHQVSVPTQPVQNRSSRPSTLREASSYSSTDLSHTLSQNLYGPTHSAALKTISHTSRHTHMGGCQNYGPFLGTLNIRCRIILGIPKRDHNFDNHPHVSGQAQAKLRRGREAKHLTKEILAELESKDRRRTCFFGLGFRV